MENDQWRGFISRCFSKGCVVMSFIDTRSISSLYRPVVEMLLVDECEFFSALRCQFSSARVLSIREDGYGIFVDFEVDPLTRIISPEIEYARVDGLVGIDKSNRLVCGFALFIEDGAIVQLDGYPFISDTWPQETVELKFISSDESGRETYTDHRSSASLSRYILDTPIQMLCK